MLNSPPRDPNPVELSVVVPVYNEAGNIRPLWSGLRPSLEGLGRSWEVLFVDDGSTDSSGGELADVRREDPRVRVLRLEPNQGQSAAFWAGFKRVHGEIVVTIDADLQNDPGDISLLLRALEDADVAIGWRHERCDPFLKRVSSRIANGFRNWITEEEVHDVGCSLKAFRRPVFDHLFPFRGMHRFFPTLARFAGFKVVEVKVRHHPRVRGLSKYGIWNRLVGPFLDCLAVRWMKKRYVGRAAAEEAADRAETSRFST